LTAPQRHSRAAASTSAEALSRPPDFTFVLSVFDRETPPRTPGHGIGGYCLACQRLFDADREGPSGYFRAR
jgi:hypothetical protein